MGLPERQVIPAMLAVLLLGIAAPRAAAAGLYTGSCEMTDDPQSWSDVALCVRGTTDAEVGLVLGDPNASEWVKYGSLYAGAFVSSWLSFQARGFWRDTDPLGDHGFQDNDRETDYAVMQLGSPVLHHLRFTAGRSRLPFGIDTTAAPQLYQVEENRALWESPHDTAYVTFDDMRQTKLEVGIATNDFDRRRHALGGLAPVGTDNAASARASFDISALEGTRLVASGYGAKVGERRFGAGVINQNRRGDYTAFEWVRRLQTPDGQTAPFEQLLRLAYMSAPQTSGRWVIQIDDERDRFRRGVVDREISLHAHLQARFGVSYTKSEDGVSPNRWSVLTGLEASL